MNSNNQQDILRKIPAVDQLLLRSEIVSNVALTSREFIVSEIQQLLQELRNAIRSGTPESDLPIGIEELVKALIDRFKNRLQPNLRTVINATGVILHTNLGRAPLSTAAQESISALSANYTNLEYELDTGQRSHRDKLVERQLQKVLGCEAAVVVNNNAAAVFLILNTLAAGREVIVSRGELVEIGGSFRIPDILTRSGAFLREVGTTNKTRVDDYQSAIRPNTALLLRVHPSNYRMQGFTERPELHEIVELAKNSRIPLVEDIGSGCLMDLKPYGIPDEPVVQDSFAAGVDLVCFSGDKLLGGPQAGIIGGARQFIDPIRRNPLMRTYRVEKLIYGALEATLQSYRCGKALSEIPVMRMIAMHRDEIKKRTRSFSRRLRAGLPKTVQLKLLEGVSVVGGGSCPQCELPTLLIAFESERVRPNTVEDRLRSQPLPIIVRLEEDKLLVDLRTVFPAQESLLIDGLCKAFAE
jgi:L-seryl-tRNA(Ser) seleniumtransferase